MPADLQSPPDLRFPADLSTRFDLGGGLDVIVTDPTGMRDLTIEGTRDWVHWGLSNEIAIDRKTGVTPLISGVMTIGTATTLHQYNDNHVTFTWSDGTPTVSSNGTNTGVFIAGQGHGLSISAPADATTRTLRVYLSGFACDFQVTAHVSDGSAYDFVDTVLFQGVNNSSQYRSYAVVYRSLAAGQTVTFSWVDLKDYLGGGNVTLQAATLQ